MTDLNIEQAQFSDIQTIIEWARHEGFAPGLGDIDIYRNTDRQGVWIGKVNSSAIGCIAGIKYNKIYGFIGLYIVKPEYRGCGYGHKLWQKAMEYLDDVRCIGLEAAPHLVGKYSEWGFKNASQTIRWQLLNTDTDQHKHKFPKNNSLTVVTGPDIPLETIKQYDAEREFTARPHFISQWLKHPSGQVIALVDHKRFCHGFARIRPCLLSTGEGWRIGPILADSSDLAEILITNLLKKNKGVILIDSPQINSNAQSLLANMGFKQISATTRMYKGSHHVPLTGDVYALACLELG